VEERVLDLQERKRHIAAAAIADGPAGGALTADDILELLE
jgi:hypothetical protein